MLGASLCWLTRQNAPALDWSCDLVYLGLAKMSRIARFSKAREQSQEEIEESIYLKVKIF